MKKHENINARFTFDAQERKGNMPPRFWRDAPREWTHPHAGHAPEYVQYSGAFGTTFCVTCSCKRFTGPEHVACDFGREPEILPSILITEFRVHMRELGL